MTDGFRKLTEVYLSGHEDEYTEDIIINKQIYELKQLAKEAEESVKELEKYLGKYKENRE